METYREPIFSSHKYCFICERSARSTKIHKVMDSSIAYAFQKYSIIIKDGLRCCRKHLDKDGNIKKNEYVSIPTTECHTSPHLLPVLKVVAADAKKNSCMDSFLFERFNNINDLDDSFCQKITGWSKLDFTRFCDHITSIKDSINRTKEQLVALYRFWLRKGTNQQTLAYLFSSGTTQQQISHYLSQIRRAIYIDVVPFYLGAHQGRDHFLNHGSEMLADLHSINETDLAIVVDGTYTRCEKSPDNQFQYNSYSGQKKASLVKPFFVCTADGYIIDCYGPFQANVNDAEIFDYILKNDQELLKHLQSSKTLVFMDRGMSIL